MKLPGVPATVGVVKPLTLNVLAAAAAMLVAALPVSVALAVAIAVIVCGPAVLKVMLNVRLPPSTSVMA